MVFGAWDQSDEDALNLAACEVERDGRLAAEITDWDAVAGDGA